MFLQFSAARSGVNILVGPYRGDSYHGHCNFSQTLFPILFHDMFPMDYGVSTA